MQYLTPEEMSFYGSIREGEAIETALIDGRLCAVKRSFAELAERIRRPGLAGLLGDATRPGVAWLTRYLEMLFFPPFTPANITFEPYELCWARTRWCLLLFPAQSIAPADMAETLARAGLVAKPGGPMAWLSDHPALAAGSVPATDRQSFAQGFIEMDLPLDNVRVLENTPGHLVYRDAAAAMRQEVARLRALQVEWEACRFEERGNA